MYRLDTKHRDRFTDKMPLRLNHLNATFIFNKDWTKWTYCDNE